MSTLIVWIADARVGELIRKPDDGLLKDVGGDVAGAITLLPDGVRPPTEPTTTPLDDQQLDALLRGLPQRPLAANSAEGIRLSLAGAQPEVPVIVRDDGQMALPTNAAAPTTHILKPEPDRFRGLVDIAGDRDGLADRDRTVDPRYRPAFVTKTVDDLLQRATAEAPRLTAEAPHDNDTARQIDERTAPRDTPQTRNPLGSPTATHRSASRAACRTDSASASGSSDVGRWSPRLGAQPTRLVYASVRTPCWLACTHSGVNAVPLTPRPV